MNRSKTRIFLIFTGDLLIFYFSLFISVYLRYKNNGEVSDFQNFFGIHLEPFSIILAPWIIIFYLANLYEPRNLKNNPEFFKNFAVALLINGALATAFFYLFPVYGIAPKTNLLLFLIVFGTLSLLWRYVFNFFSSAIGIKENVLIVGSASGKEPVEEITNHLETNPQLGYEIKKIVGENNMEISEVPDIIKKNKISIVAVSGRLGEKTSLSKILYKHIPMGIRVVNFSEFYELIFKKIPLSELEESWFLENILKPHRIYDAIKRPLEFIAAFFLLVVLSPLFLFIALMVKFSSKGPFIYKHVRVGKNEKDFVFYKFRTMKEGGTHLMDKYENKITGFGKILRKTHLDELPQLVNIVKGELSFIGPRPDFIDFFRELDKVIPYYNIRTVIKPGITGWAQVNYPVTISMEQTKERLSYDLYYMKNRSFFLDLAIIIKTVKSVFTASGF